MASSQGSTTPLPSTSAARRRGERHQRRPGVVADEAVDLETVGLLEAADLGHGARTEVSVDVDAVPGCAECLLDREHGRSLVAQPDRVAVVGLVGRAHRRRRSRPRWRRRGRRRRGRRAGRWSPPQLAEHRSGRAWRSWRPDSRRRSPLAAPQSCRRRTRRRARTSRPRTGRRSRRGPTVSPGSPRSSRERLGAADCIGERRATSHPRSSSSPRSSPGPSTQLSTRAAASPRRLRRSATGTAAGRCRAPTSVGENQSSSDHAVDPVVRERLGEVDAWPLRRAARHRASRSRPRTPDLRRP